MNKKSNNNENDEDIDSDEKKKKKSDDMSYRSLYRTILGYKELITIDSSKIRVPQKDKNENNKEIEKPKEKSFSQGVEQFDINLENASNDCILLCNTFNSFKFSKSFFHLMLIIYYNLNLNMLI